MKLKVQMFNELIKRATFNLSINSIHLNVTQDKIKSSMVSSASDIVALVNIDNNIFVGNNNFEYDLYFNDPNTNILSYTNIIENEEVEVEIKESFMNLINGKEKFKLSFCHPNIVTKFQSRQKDISEFKFYEFKMNEDFVKIFNKVKKIGSKFGKIYFMVIDEILSIVATDNQNAFSNILKIEFAELPGVKNLNICFDYKNISNFFSLLDEDFVVVLAYVDEKQLGMLEAADGDKEKFFIMSKRDI